LRLGPCKTSSLAMGTDRRGPSRQARSLREAGDAVQIDEVCGDSRDLSACLIAGKPVVPRLSSQDHGAAVFEISCAGIMHGQVAMRRQELKSNRRRCAGAEWKLAPG